MSPLVIAEGLALIVLLGLSAFFSSAEVAFFSLNPLQVRRLKQSNPKLGGQVEWNLSSPTRLLSTILIGNTLVNVAVSAVAFALAEHFFVQGELIAIAASLFLLVIFGEIGPKRVAVAHPARMASLYAPALVFATASLAPLRYLLDRITESFAHLFHPRGRVLSEEEFVSVVDESGKEGILDEDERAMVRGIIRLEDLRASDVMTPRVDIIGIDIEDEAAEIDQVVASARVRHILIYRKTLDNVQGFLDVRRYRLDPDYAARKQWTPPPYVPESSPLDKLLSQFLHEQRRVAVVVDEYGGTAGVITRGDILEEITGEIEDELGGHELLFTRSGPDRWLLDGQVNLETISDQLGITFEELGVDRIAGWIAAKLERLPRPGDSVEANNTRFTVRQMRKNRVTVVEARRMRPAP